MIMAAPSVLGELIPCGGGDPIPLLKPKLLVGRRSHCDIQLQFPNVSSHHCELEWVNGFWRVLDLNSSNGVKVNGVRVDTKWLMPLDILSVGKHRYEVAYAPEGQRPPDEDEDPFARGLLEKAGLERTGETRRGADASAAPVASAALPPPKKRTKTVSGEDDEAMKWLSEL